MKKKQFFLFFIFSISLLIPQNYKITGNKGVWKNYLTVDGISSNYIYDVFVDEDNSIWLSTTSGVTQYNGSQFINYGTESGLPPSNIKNILSISSGNIVAVSETNGAYKLKNGKFELISGLYGNSIYASSIDNNGNLVLTTEKGVFIYENGKFNAIINLGSKIITAIDYFKNEAWYGGKGKIYFDNGQSIENYSLPNEVGQVKVTSIVSSESSESFIGTDKGLFKIKNGSLNRVKSFDNLSSNVIKSLYMDKEQNLWVGTDKGLYYKDGANFTQIESTVESKNQIENQKIYSINFTNDRLY